MIRLLLIGLAAYLAGAFPSGVIVGRLWRGANLLREGSGNPGTVNALRVLGLVPGSIVFLLDFGKGLAASALPAAYFGAKYGWLGGLMAVLGHIYPIYVCFRGGKGLATGGGALSFLAPGLLAVFVPVWAVFYLWRRQTSLASAIAVLAVFAVAAVTLPRWAAAAACLALAVIFWRHWPEARQALGWR